MTATQTLAATPAVETDPVQARAQFFFDLELMELSAVIPQAAPRGVAKY
ncbi:MAG: hypothetical protein JWM80_2142 [Cyanobacteria bacterium RYN_339]|nr:hypothetical protein [Cyanobacteria bacterium RYN_339]